MSSIRKKCMAMLLAVLLLLPVLPVFASDEGYEGLDYQTEDRTVVVYAQDETDYLYLRIGPSMEYQIICKVYNGSEMSLNASCLDPSGSFRWGKVEYKGLRGWVSMIHTVTPETYAVVFGQGSSSENGTSEPSKEHSVEPTPTIAPGHEVADYEEKEDSDAKNDKKQKGYSGFTLVLVSIFSVILTLMAVGMASLVMPKRKKNNGQ